MVMDENQGVDEQQQNKTKQSQSREETRDGE